MKTLIFKIILAALVVAFMFVLSQWAINNDRREFLILNLILVLIPLSLLFDGLANYLTVLAHKLDN